MKKIIPFLLIVLGLNFSVFSQKDYSLWLDFTIWDYPYDNLAWQTYGNAQFLTSPSMKQTTNLTANLVSASLYYSQKLNLNLSNSSIINSLIYSSYYTALYLLLEYIPGGIAWTHEEYHRAILTANNVQSFDETYQFKFLSSVVKVKGVEDQDLINFKKNNPQNFIRLHSAGIEGENALAFELYKRAFFYGNKISYTMFTSSSILNSFFYIYFCQTQDAEIETDLENARDGTNIYERDFTGFDFTAWVYDLYKPYEPYEQRGIHPSGVGIDRYVKPSDLSAEQLALLKKQSFFHLLNIITPFTLGIREINLKNGNKFNFTFRHLLTSFGNDIAFYTYFKTIKNLNFIAAIHLYNSKYLHLPGIEFQFFNIEKQLANISIHNNFAINLFMQPENLLYFDKNYFTGYYLNYEISFGNKKFFPYIGFSYKSKGWVASELFLTNSFEMNFGFKVGF